ncbi:MAG TPA: aspartate racemase [Gammaproteobacteria bacterium]|nr:aspartate racemase [Gammaproteobacteria bacterium]|tara:strand:+ start:129 stop:863 length:735 start_codon:yes stop_codon:yes gene_type:complete
MRTKPLQQKIIGVLGGCSNVATAEYYRLLNEFVNTRLGGWEIAETLIVGMNFGNIEAWIRTGDDAAMEAYLHSKVDQLEAANVDVVLCVSNTLHPPLERVVAKRKTPFLHIVEVTGKVIRARGLDRVALLGTRPVMQSEQVKLRYVEQFGISVVTPNDAEQIAVDRIIFDELVKGKVLLESRQVYVDIAQRLAAEAGIQGLIMGCTEIFTLLRQEDLPAIPLFDTTRLHCEAAVEFALDGVLSA